MRGKIYPQAPTRPSCFKTKRKFTELIAFKFIGQSQYGFRVVRGGYCFVVSRFCFLLSLKLFRVSTMSI